MTQYHKEKLLKQLARFKLDFIYCKIPEQDKENNIINNNLTSIEKQLKRL